MCKIGRACDFVTRSGHYPRGSEILVVLPCDSMLDTENAIKAAMCEAGFRRCDEVGCETFEGDRDTMMWTMITTTLNTQIGVGAGVAPSVDSLLDTSSMAWVKHRLLNRKIDARADLSAGTTTDPDVDGEVSHLSTESTEDDGPPYEHFAARSVPVEEDVLPATSEDDDPVDLDGAMVAFVKANEADFAGTNLKPMEVNTRFVEFCRSHEVAAIRAASKTKHHMFVRTLLRRTDAKRVVVRDGLVVEHLIKFAGLAVGTFIEPVCINEQVAQIVEESDPLIENVLEFVGANVDFNPLRTELFKGRSYYAWITEKELMAASWAWFTDKQNKANQEFRDGLGKASGSKVQWKAAVKNAMRSLGRPVRMMKPLVDGKQQQMLAVNGVAWVGK